ncbi:MAG TPA: NrfD/PsrC family molybdoenzyme membrane anchor subunit [Dissulfurispiraceae bacterium]|nr:NrfD/PsrC family molybdoenzyme membrane anchor subunit [Dissulfurispiraceae bacterium]
MNKNVNYAARAGNSSGGFMVWFMDKLFMGMSLSEYSRSLITPFNLLAASILATSLPVFISRYGKGLASVLDASNEYPWGLLLSWGIFAGEPLFAAGFVVASGYYLFGIKSYRPLVRLAVLGGMLGYAFAASYLLIDLGRPWRIYYPMLINFGPSSVLFVVAWHVALYVTVQLMEFSPAILEWLGSKRLHKWAISITVALIIGGVILSTVHQSALGAMYLITPGKLHPLWYTSHLPLLFFSSAVYAAMSFAILLAFAAVRYFRERCDNRFVSSIPTVTLSLGKAAAVAMYIYFALKVIALAQDDRWGLLLTPLGSWYLVELLGFVALPMVLFSVAVKRESIGLIRFSALWAVLGIVLNRVNVNLIAYNWNLPNHWSLIIPSSGEVLMILAMITLHILVFRWIMNRFPVTRELSEYKNTH